MKRITLHIFLLLFCSTPAAAQPYFAVRPIVEAGGLPSGSIPWLFQDSDGFMWLGTPEGLYRYDGHRMLGFRSEAGRPGLLASNEITHIAEDSRGRLLVGNRRGVDILDRATGNIRHMEGSLPPGTDIRYIHVSSSDGAVWIGSREGLCRYDADLALQRDYTGLLPPGTVGCMYEDRAGNLWMTISEGGGLFRYLPTEDRFERLPPVGKSDDPRRIYQDDRSNYWIGTWGDGLFRFFSDAPDTEKYIPVHITRHDSGEVETEVYGIVQDDTYGYIWLVSYSGLYALRYAPGGEIEQIDTSGLVDESNNILGQIVKDRDGNLWVGTYREGAFMINFDRSQVRNIPLESVRQLTGITPSVTTLWEDRLSGDIWFNQDRWGLARYEAATGRVTSWRDYPRLRSYSGLDEVSCIVEIDPAESEVWLGLRNEPAILVMRKREEGMEIVRRIDLAAVAADTGHPHKIFVDRGGRVWIVTSNALLLKPAGSDEVVPVSFLLGRITDITDDGGGHIWISTRDEGIHRLNRNLVATSFTAEGSPLPTNDICAVHADDQGRLWIGTREGSILTLDIATGEFSDISSTFHMIGGSIHNIVSDAGGHIWISTGRRVIEYNPRTLAVKEYSASGGDVLVNAFVSNSLFRNSRGEMMYGGSRGISVFTPTDDLSGPKRQPRVFVSDVKVNNVSVFSGNDNRRYDMSARRLTLDPSDGKIEIEFSALNYHNSDMAHYAYKMSGIDDDWIRVDYREFAVYNQLKRGRYTFSVRAMNSSGLWSPHVTELEIRKRPALWESWWAFAVYVLAAAGAAHTAWRAARSRMKLRSDLRIARIEREKSEELAQTKLRYFTNVSHDFLTPLTVMSCLLDDAEATGDGAGFRFEAMHDNIDRLRRLLQQVLDFRRIESGNMKLSVSRADAAGFIRRLCLDNFAPLMERKGIAFSLEATPPQIDGWFDADKIDKIVFNLLSNAHKYTPSGGRVEVRMAQHTVEAVRWLTLSVADSGVGISDADRIFTRFWSGDMSEAAGSNGIGLNLTKDLVELHRGTIGFESRRGVGSTFTVELPLDRRCYPDAEIDRTPETETEPETASAAPAEPPAPLSDLAEGMHILIVEDNAELLALMSGIFSRSYRVSTATDGTEALAAIRTLEPDMVVSDVMMPGMDGLELCRAIKGDIETSHIPVLMLTARSGPEDRVECYDAGADGYISKPFDLKVLEARIRNFIAGKKRRQHDFRTGEAIDVGVLEYRSRDEVLLRRAVAIIEEHITDSDFDIGTLASRLHLSESTLYRKIKQMTGLSPARLVRNVRLKHACTIIRDHSLPVAEVAWAVGFSDPNYFASCFKSEFGLTPTDFRRAATAAAILATQK
ncbi:MAG: response regulator [Alistipes sp.]|jgi:signal transduction histidine kinase/DNA-binding response OmpR family regulator/ligand-binding sensor domain-containing protein|nr:response regulator [Alistipes sp.]